MYLFCCCAANQFSEITALFLTFQTKTRILKVNKCEIFRENASNLDFFEIEDNHESSKVGLESHKKTNTFTILVCCAGTKQVH